MLLTEQGKEFLENMSLYKEFGLHTLVNIGGIDILKGNKILPVSTIYLESDEGDILFVADYCTPKEEKELTKKIKQEFDITNEKNFVINENENPEKAQEMIKYIAYANPDIRPVLFDGEVEINNNKIVISENKILINESEDSPQRFLSQLFSPDDSKETKIELINELEKKKVELVEIMEQLIVLTSALQKETVLPKVIDVDGNDTLGIIFKDEKGKYKALTVNNEKPEVISSFKIIRDSSWTEISEGISKSDFLNNTKNELIEKLIEGKELE